MRCSQILRIQTMTTEFYHRRWVDEKVGRSKKKESLKDNPPCESWLSEEESLEEMSN